MGSSKERRAILEKVRGLHPDKVGVLSEQNKRELLDLLDQLENLDQLESGSKPKRTIIVANERLHREALQARSNNLSFVKRLVSKVRSAVADNSSNESSANGGLRWRIDQLVEAEAVLASVGADVQFLVSEKRAAKSSGSTAIVKQNCHVVSGKARITPLFGYYAELPDRGVSVDSARRLQRKYLADMHKSIRSDSAHEWKWKLGRHYSKVMDVGELRQWRKSNHSEAFVKRLVQRKSAETAEFDEVLCHDLRYHLNNLRGMKESKVRRKRGDEKYYKTWPKGDRLSESK